MKHERGIILLVVVWALTVLMVVAAELARSMRIEGMTTVVYQQEAQTYYLALAGFNRALYHFLRAGQEGRTLLTQPGALNRSEHDTRHDIWARGDGRWQNEEVAVGGYWVRVSDEGGKINLNQVDDATLRQTFTNLGFEGRFVDELTDAILDWRDPDPLVRLHGAESEYYLSLPVPYPAKDGPFDTIDELLLVRGITPALFFGQDGPGLREVFTVYASGGRGRVNLLTAGPLVLQAVLGIDADAARDLVQQRTDTGGAELPGGMTGASNLSLPLVATIESMGYLHAGGVTRRLSAVVQRFGVSGFRILRWQDRQEGTTRLVQREE